MCDVRPHQDSPSPWTPSIRESDVTPSQRDGAGRSELLTKLMAPSFLREAALALPGSFSVGKKSLGFPGCNTSRIHHLLLKPALLLGPILRDSSIIPRQEQKPETGPLFWAPPSPFLLQDPEVQVSQNSPTSLLHSPGSKRGSAFPFQTLFSSQVPGLGIAPHLLSLRTQVPLRVSTHISSYGPNHQFNTVF